MTTSTVSVPSLAEELRRLGGDLVTGKVSDTQFFAAFQTSAEDAPQFGLRVLRQALSEHDARLVDFGAYVGHRFGFVQEHAELLMQLAEAPWHQSHENIVFGLNKLRDARSVDVLCRTTRAKYAYLEYDDTFSLGVKCIWGLAAIADQRALDCLDQLASSGNEVYRDSVIQQLTRVLMKPATEQTRLVVASLLERPDRIPLVLENALGRHDAGLLSFGLTAGLRLGLDDRSIGSLAKLARKDFHHCHAEVRAALASIRSEAASRALRNLGEEKA
jgi:hypothetical protein